MADFNIRSDSVNVEQIMQQIRARIREKRGVDYTEQQIRELAAVKLERFLDPQKVRSGLLEQFQKGGVSPFENYSFEDTTLFESHRAPLRWIRRLLRPILMLFFNPNPLIRDLHLQSGINTRHQQNAEISYELLHNLVLETTRLAIDVKNVKMRVESISSRFDFAERRARALEGIVQYRSGDMVEEPPARGRAAQGPGAQGQSSPGQAEPSGPTSAGRDAEQAGGGDAPRRRRRRGRRGGASRVPGEGVQAGAAGAPGVGDDEAPSGADGRTPTLPDHEDQ
jgi:hypothetical protein